MFVISQSSYVPYENNNHKKTDSGFKQKGSIFFGYGNVKKCIPKKGAHISKRLPNQVSCFLHISETS